MTWKEPVYIPNATMQVRFVSGKGCDSRIIELFSGNKWSHVEIYFGDSTFGAQWHGGVRWRSVADPCYDKAREYEVWDIPITSAQTQLLMRLMQDATFAPYDWPAIPSFMFGQHRLHLQGAWICSGFIAGVFDSLRLLVINLPWENYNPRDIWILIPQIAGARKIT